MTLQQNKTPQCLIENGKTVADTSELLKIWKSYIETLFHDKLPETYANIDKELSGPPITKAEMKKVILFMKNNKAPGPDGIHAEILKLLNESGPQLLDILLPLFW